MQLVDPAKQFAKDSLRLVKRCTKPDRKGKYIVYKPHYRRTCCLGFRPGPKVLKLFSWSTQLSMKFKLLINTEIAKINHYQWKFQV